MIGNDDRRLEHAVGKHFGRHLECRERADEGNELLRQAFAESGQTRVPVPPHMMTGRIFTIFPLPREEYRNCVPKPKLTYNGLPALLSQAPPSTFLP